MAKKKLSVGVTAALIGAAALIVATLVPLALHQDEKATQSISNSNGNIQAGRDVNIQSSDSAKAIKQYDEKFDAMTAKRRIAGIACLEYLSKTNWDLVTNDTDGLDDVLNFFDVMGYEMESKQVSSNDVYEYFCDDIISYYQTSKGYVDKIETDDPTAWVHFKPLYATMVIMNAAEPPKVSTNEIYFLPSELVKYFKAETNSVNLK
ncbi:MAG TPA: hypothetical protein VNV43_00685 [Candidatus Acidoferrales bacterium]|jgi:hypothetical protein|nr:hypothetical protein [Candidatus Acidoferrales bacterium]